MLLALLNLTSRRSQNRKRENTHHTSTFLIQLVPVLAILNRTLGDRHTFTQAHIDLGPRRTSYLAYGTDFPNTPAVFIKLKSVFAAFDQALILRRESVHWKTLATSFSSTTARRTRDCRTYFWELCDTLTKVVQNLVRRTESFTKPDRFTTAVLWISFLIPRAERLNAERRTDWFGTATSLGISRGTIRTHALNAHNRLRTLTSPGISRLSIWAK